MTTGDERRTLNEWSTSYMFQERRGDSFPRMVAPLVALDTFTFWWTTEHVENGLGEERKGM